MSCLSNEGLDEIICSTPPAPFRESPINLKRAADVLQIVDGLYEYWPMRARGIYYKVISAPAFAEPHWLCQKGKNKGKPLVDPYSDAIIPILKYLRLSGQIPMSAINDDDRIVTPKSGQEDPEEFTKTFIGSIFPTYRQCTASNQQVYIEVWSEKNGLVHILEPIADKFCRRVVGCKGFQSLPLYHAFAQRASKAVERGQRPMILYCGDYDPSGLQIPKTIKATLEQEHNTPVNVYRFALTTRQLDGLIPVQLKKSDKRAKRYTEETGFDVGWELDALSPERLQAELESALTSLTDMDLMRLDEGLGDKVNEKLEAVEEEVLPILEETCRQHGLIR